MTVKFHNDKVLSYFIYNQTFGSSKYIQYQVHLRNHVVPYFHQKHHNLTNGYMGQSIQEWTK